MGCDATSVTVAVASSGAVLDDDYAELSESAALAHLGSDTAEEKSVPPMISLKALADFPDGNLARQLLSMWVYNGFDPEVLDRDAISLNRPSPALRYLNMCILQMHYTWHMVAGYITTEKQAEGSGALVDKGDGLRERTLLSQACSMFILCNNIPDNRGVHDDCDSACKGHDRHVQFEQWQQKWLTVISPDSCKTKTYLGHA